MPVTTTFAWTDRNELYSTVDTISNTTRFQNWFTNGQLKQAEQRSNTNTLLSKRTLTYDGIARLKTDVTTNATNVTKLSTTYGYDTNGNVNSKIIGPTGIAGVGTHTYEYDAGDRLTKWTNQSNVASVYGYDAVGNRTTAGATTYTYDGRNRLTQSGTQTRQWNKDGTLLSTTTGTTTTSYTWDAFGSLTGSGTTVYTYDALGRVTTRKVGTAAATLFGYSGSGSDPSSVGQTVVARTPADGLLTGSSSSTSSWMFSRDRHGDVTAKTTTSGTVNGSVMYSPFGQRSTTAGSALGEFGFQGDWTDPTSGLVFQGTRWYEPTTGAFISRDTVFGRLDSPVSLNRYTYGLNNPLRYFDPDGRESEAAALANVLFGSETWHPTDSSGNPGYNTALHNAYNSSIVAYENMVMTQALEQLAELRIMVGTVAGMNGGDQFDLRNDQTIREIAHTVVQLNQSLYDIAAHNNTADNNLSKSDFQAVSESASGILKLAADVLLSDDRKPDGQAMVGWRAWETKPKQDWLDRNWKTIVTIGAGVIGGVACAAAGPAVASMCGGIASRFVGGQLNGNSLMDSFKSAFDPKALAFDAVTGIATAAIPKGINKLKGTNPTNDLLNSTDDLTRTGATNRAGMDSFLDNGATVRHSGTATAIGDDANTLTNFGRSQGAAGHDVVVHGQVVNGQANFVTNGMPTHTQQIADAVLSNPGYVRGSPVQLVTCRGACGLADELSQALGGARVTASPHLVDLDPATGLLRSWK